MSDRVEIEVLRSRADYTSAFWLNYWRGRGVVLHLAVCAMIAIWGTAETIDELGLVTALVAGATGGTAIFTILLFFHSAGAWGNMPHLMGAPGALEPVEFVFSLNEVHMRMSLGSATVSWAAYRDWLEDGRVILIRSRGNLVQVLPKREMSPETLERLRSLLRTVFLQPSRIGSSA